MMQHSLNWQSGHVSIERQKKITKKYNILSKHNQRRSKTRVLSAFAKATRTAQLPRMKKLSCDQTVPIFYQTVKMLLSSCCQAFRCHKVLPMLATTSSTSLGQSRPTPPASGAQHGSDDFLLHTHKDTLQH